MNSVLSPLIKIEHYDRGYETTYLLAPSQLVLLTEAASMQCLALHSDTPFW